MSTDDLQQVLGNPFDPRTVEPQSDWEVLPPGKYPVYLDNAEVLPTKTGGTYLKLSMFVLEGPHRNRKLWANINLQNQSEKCVEIGLRELAALGMALGGEAIRGTAQLIDRVVVAHVVVKNDKNEVRTFSSAGPASNPPSPTQPGSMNPAGVTNLYRPAQPAPPAKPMPGGAPPWARARAKS